jgi:N,N-dimethylformamidase beta subunit-like, C-terminal
LASGNSLGPALVVLCAIAAAVNFAGCGSAPVNCESARQPISASDRPNPIALENEKPGDASWQLSNPATQHEIEGYASAASVNRGESISLFVNTAEPSYTLEVFRMGWYGGAGARAMTAPITRPGTQQPIPQMDPDTGLIECQWTDPYTLTIPANPTDPTDWASGVYLVKLTAGSSGKQSYIIFVVRDDERRSDLLFQASVNTYEAYNDWGGRSLYSHPRAFKVSFNRPYVRGDGSGDFLWSRGGWEYNMLRFLEREGYDVTYSTDVDTHARGSLLLLHNGFLVVGHDEYWSWRMRKNVEEARDAGVSLGFFAANTCFWQIRYERSRFTNDPDRTIVCYKTDSPSKDPMYSDPSNRYLATVTWRQRPVNRPEDKLVGVMYDWNLGSPNADMVVHDASNWVFAGTGLQNGDHLPGLLGYEADRMFGHAPGDIRLLARSPVRNPVTGRTGHSDMTVYTTNTCGVVVATGSMQWNWGLDDYGAHQAPPTSPDPPLTNPAVQQVTRNILNRFGARAGTPLSPAR